MDEIYSRNSRSLLLLALMILPKVFYFLPIISEDG